MQTPSRPVLKTADGRAYVDTQTAAALLDCHPFHVKAVLARANVQPIRVGRAHAWELAAVERAARARR